MSARTVDWTALRAAQSGVPKTEGLRERKKRLMRQQLTDTATQLFLERGFDAVRVAEIADACGVSEKTVFNYFPTKEALLLDLFDTTMSSLRTGLADREVSPVDAALHILAGELGAMMSWLAQQDDPAQAAAAIRRFGMLIQSTPALRAHQRDTLDQLITVAAELLAERAGFGPADPEPRIAAIALLGLWQIQFQSLGKHLNGSRTPTQVEAAVTTDVHRAANVLNTGLSCLASGVL